MTGSEKAFIGLGWNCIGLITIIVWTGTMCWIMFYGLKSVEMLRVQAELEFRGKLVTRKQLLQSDSFLLNN